METLEQKESNQLMSEQTHITQKLLKYSLLSIKKIDSYVNSLETLLLKSLDGEIIGVNKGFNFVFNKENGIFTIRTKIDFQCRNESPNPLLLFGVVVQYDYLFQDYEGVIKGTEENKVEIPNDLLLNLMSISFSSSRGILADLTAGTDYNNIFLPLIDIQEFKKSLHPNDVPESK
jgi:hypothetical protein